MPHPLPLRSGGNHLTAESENEAIGNDGARRRDIKPVQDYDEVVRQFPTNLTQMLFCFREKAQFTAENGKAISKPPKVDFGAPSRSRA